MYNIDHFWLNPEHLQINTQKFLVDQRQLSVL